MVQNRPDAGKKSHISCVGNRFHKIFKFVAVRYLPKVMK